MEVTEESIREIELIHSSWLRFEIAGEHEKVIALCADDIQFRPPHEQPIFGRYAVLIWMAQNIKRVLHVEIRERRIGGSNEIAYLTAGYTTTFSVPRNFKLQQVRGNHVWLLRKESALWRVILVSWSIV